MEKQKKRSEIDSKFKWAIEDLYKCDSDWEAELEETKALAKNLEKYQGVLGVSSKNLLDFFKLQDEIAGHLERVYVYANQKYHEDTSNSTYQDFSGKASSLEVMIRGAVSFAVPEILSLDEEVLKKFMEEEEGLKQYEFALTEILRQKPHTLSKEMEEVLANAGEMAESPSNIFSMFNNADIKFPQIEGEDGNLVDVTHGRYSMFLENPNQRIRRDAFKSVYSVYRNFKNTLAATFIANLKQESFMAKTRNYSSAMTRALDDSNVPVNVYTNLIDAVHDNMHLMHRYVTLRKKLLKLDELHMYDLYLPIVEDADMKIDFEQAKEMVYDGLHPLGEEYRSKLREGYDNGWIDVYENEGKRSGAYSWGAYGTHPYVLLNYQDNLNNVFTLAHEMGHALHSYHSDAALPITYAGYRTFVAEVASTCNEALLMEHLLEKTTDKKQRAFLLNHFLEQFKSTLYRQTMFAEFEMIVHEKAANNESLTADVLCETYLGLVHQYFGDDIIIDEEIAMEWARIPHFYTAFYVYQYATGYSAAIAISRRILKEGKPAVDDYIKFLSSGGSDYPIELLKIAGVDMSTRTPVNEALQLFGSLLDEMEELLAE